MSSEQLTRRAILSGGCQRIPGMVYSKPGFATQTVQYSWRARVSRIETVAQLALEVRLLDSAIVWQDFAKPEGQTGRPYLMNIRVAEDGGSEYLVVRPSDRGNASWIKEAEAPLWLRKEKEDSLLIRADEHRARILDRARIPLNGCLPAIAKTVFLRAPESCTRPYLLPSIHEGPARIDTLDRINDRPGPDFSFRLCVCGAVCSSAPSYWQCIECHQKLHKECVRSDSGVLTCTRCGASVIIRNTKTSENGKSHARKERIPSQAPPAPVVPQPRAPPNQCGVCLDSDSHRLLRCKECGIAVHVDCYSSGHLDFDLARLTWVCDPCLQGVEDPKCTLCPVRGGPLRSTVEGLFAHVVCALYLGETYFEERTGKVAGVGSIDPTRYKLRCRVCKLSGFAPPQCTLKSCGIAMHPLCARKEGLPLFEDEERGEIVLKMFCAKHKDREDAKPQAAWRGTAQEVLVDLRDRPDSEYFRKPVNLEDADYENYLDFVEQPMDLSTIFSRLESGRYFSPEGLHSDLSLMFWNCRNYHTGRKRTAGLLSDCGKFEEYCNQKWKEAFPDFVVRPLPSLTPRDNGPVKPSQARPEPDASGNRLKHENWRPLAEDILRRLLKEPFAEPFREPVPYERLGLTDYCAIVKVPSDLGSTLDKLVEDRFRTLEALCRDIRRTFDNCRLYNGYEPTCPVMVACVQCEKFLEREWNPKLGSQGVGLTFTTDMSDGKQSNAVSTKPTGRKVPQQWHATVSKIVKEVRALDEAFEFLQPVDEREYPEYREHVKRPMDLETVHKQLDAGKYERAEDVLADVRQIWSNCHLFNGDDQGLPIIRDCDYCEEVFEKRWLAAKLPGARNPAAEEERSRPKRGHQIGFKLSKLGEQSVGCDLKLWALQEKRWVGGNLREFSEWRREYVVVYDDGYAERVNLREEEVKLVRAPEVVWKAIGQTGPVKRIKSETPTKNGSQFAMPLKRSRTLSDSKRLAMLEEEAVGRRIELVDCDHPKKRRKGVVMSFNRRRSEFRVAFEDSGGTTAVKPDQVEVRLLGSRRNAE
eukprot:Plantae.Rhodophyta-Rhodochaete_pulchella.ctg1844.p1 GENE.Plantae.Rhodophyta-Rhodochaete_pulchella.ctg1844~~Plantae.Rhodophyta-Rhodochaete_pulchella.ctg1844.p1  ORF type:complete len:1070 (+),score=142.46 Plantae.Rhodophyta-Rhodochaete_pulchella.ctg1844:98-3211(+)